MHFIIQGTNLEYINYGLVSSISRFYFSISATLVLENKKNTLKSPKLSKTQILVPAFCTRFDNDG